MTTLPIAFVTFKRVVLTTLASGPLNVRVERSGPDWTCILDDGKSEIFIPPNKALIISEAAAEGFAKAALQVALEEFEAHRLDEAEPAEGTVQ